MLLFMFAGFSYWYSSWPGMSEFAVYYRAGKIVLDPTIQNTQIYNWEDRNLARYGVPYDNIPTQYRYSMFATYLIAPFSLINYRISEAIFIFLNLLCYATSIYVLLKSFGARKRWLFYPVMASFLWMPFIQNIRYVQINAILLLIMTIAIVAARREKYILSGVLLAVATLFKPFFLAVTMVLCIKNWRIVVGYLPVIILALMLPGTNLWFKSFLWPPHPFSCYSALYSYLGYFNEYYFLICALAIGFITALITYRNRQLDFFTLSSFGIVGAFLTMPIIEGNHLTILIFGYINFLFMESSIREKLFTGISFILIFLGSYSIYGASLMYIGLLVLWAIMAYMVVKYGEMSKIPITSFTIASNCD